MSSALVSTDLPFVATTLSAASGVTNWGVDSFEGLDRYIVRNPGFSLVARRAGASAAFVLSGHDARRGHSHHLFVLPESRRQGIATALVMAALAGLKGAGIAKAHVDVLGQNEGARAFGSRRGWQLRNDISKFSVVIAGGANA